MNVNAVEMEQYRYFSVLSIRVYYSHCFNSVITAYSQPNKTKCFSLKRDKFILKKNFLNVVEKSVFITNKKKKGLYLIT